MNLETILEGVFALSVLVAGGSVGYLSLRKALRQEAEMVKWMLALNGGAIASMSLVQLGHVLDFLSILLLKRNLDPYANGFLSYIPAGAILVCGLYVGSRVMVPKYGRQITAAALIAGIWYTAYLVLVTGLSPSSIYSIENYNPGDTAALTMVDTSLKVGTFPFLMFLAAGLTGLVFNGFGFLRIAGKSGGTLRRDNALVGLGWILWIVFAVADALVGILPLLMLSRVMQSVAFVLIFFGMLWGRL